MSKAVLPAGKVALAKGKLRRVPCLSCRPRVGVRALGRFGITLRGRGCVERQTPLAVYLCIRHVSGDRSSATEPGGGGR